ncbi:hypothetical protein METBISCDRAFT_31502 [Metschnikowia bicuspidata]|uniref:TPR-like protein n=1 Tax=Metschnikowia bicuspidata TaxID=27322 RepID=A0A4P9ZA79_9ASCO|nr:hypothetical protein METBISCDRAFT_31502 [Metschnikowia bicuspidata]
MNGLSSRRHHFQAFNTRPSRLKRVLTINLWLVTCTAVAYYLWWPKHTFPSSVAKHLRNGLWAESDKGEKDYQLALKHYLEALEECNRLKMDPLTDEYTGILLKIGEMYERMDRAEDAALVYNELATLYLAVLKAAPSSAMGSRVRGSAHRAHLIQKDLRIALKLVELNHLNALLSKAILITHLLIAQEEVNKRLGSLADLASIMNASDLFNKDIDKNVSEAQKLLSQLSCNAEAAIAPATIVIETNPEAWEPFAEEFFNAMDVLSAICISEGDVETASGIRIAMAAKMVVAGVSPERLLIAQCNTASLLYFQAEQLEAQEFQMRQNFAEVAGVDHDKIKAIHDHLHPTTVAPEEAEEIRQKVKTAASKDDMAQYEKIIANKNELLKMVVAIYQSVIDGSKQLSGEVANENVVIAESVALATYGLGVVHLHLAKYDKAERFLREARVRSKGCQYDALIGEIEYELVKLFEERKTMQQKSGGAIEMDIHFNKTIGKIKGRRGDEGK